MATIRTVDLVHENERRRGRKTGSRTGDKAAKSAGDLGFEATLWKAADTLRGNLESSEYKHVVLGLIFLKYISDTFEERRAALAEEEDADPEDRDEYAGANVFWVPTEARWSTLQASARLPSIGQLVDKAMAAVERDNPRLKGVLPQDYARPALDKRRLGELIDLVSTIGLGSQEHRSRDVLGRVYEYFLSQFAANEGRRGGEFYTPRSVVRLLVEMLEPRAGSRIYDPCCGSGGMFVQSEKFIAEHSDRVGGVSIFGQELNHTTWRMCLMNLAIRGVDASIAEGDTFHNDQNKDRKFDFILANPPFNVSDWGGTLLPNDVRWAFGTPPANNANYAWIQHFIHHLAPTGTAGFVMANTSLSSNAGGESEIRRNIVEADLVDCMIALPGQLFFTTPIPVCLWFLARDKRNHRFRDRRGHVLFIDAQKLGEMVDRTHRELTDDEISRIARTYHAWRGEFEAGEYADVPGFCRSASLAEIESHGFVLTPGRYVGAEDLADDDEPFEDKLPRLVAALETQFAEGARLAETIRLQMGLLRGPGSP